MGRWFRGRTDTSLLPLAHPVLALFNPALQLTAVQLLDTNDLADRIRIAGETILLSLEEYATVRRAAEVATGYMENDVEFVRRILNAEEVEVEESTVKA